MSRTTRIQRFGAPPTTSSLLADISAERGLLSRAVAAVRASATTLAALAAQVDVLPPTMQGYHGITQTVPRIDRDALVAARDEALHNAVIELTALLNDLRGAPAEAH